MLMLLSSSPPSTLHANNFTRLTTHRLRDICRNLKKGRKPILNMMKLAVLIALSALCSASAAERSLLQAGLPNFPLPASPPPPPSPPITPGTPPPPPPSSPDVAPVPSSDKRGCESILWIGIFQHFARNDAAYQAWQASTCSIPHITLPDGNIQQINLVGLDLTPTGPYMTAR